MSRLACVKSGLFSDYFNRNTIVRLESNYTGTITDYKSLLHNVQHEGLIAMIRTVAQEPNSF